MNKEKDFMRKIALIAAVAAAAVATPALANEGRAEVRGGIVWAEGDSEETLGVAAGYDWDFGSDAFFGVEVSGDKVLADGADISLGLNGRVGVKLDGGTKLYGVTGYQSEPCDFCGDAWGLGAGAEFPFGDKLYGKAEYRHFFAGDNFVDTDAVTVGLGMKF